MYIGWVSGRNPECRTLDKAKVKVAMKEVRTGRKVCLELRRVGIGKNPWAREFHRSQI